MAKKKTAEQLFEKLALMVKRGFDETASKQDLAALRNHVDSKIVTLADSLDQLQRDMRDVKVILGPLARGVVEHEEKLKNLERRVVRVEQKIGLGR